MSLFYNKRYKLMFLILKYTLYKITTIESYPKIKASRQMNNFTIIPIPTIYTSKAATTPRSPYSGTFICKKNVI